MVMAVRYVRIRPTAWHGHTSMRATLDLWVEGTHDMPYTRHKYSSIFDKDPLGKGHGQGRLDSTQAWSMGAHDSAPWMQLDAGQVGPVTGVVIKGRADFDQRVTSFSVESSEDEKSWKVVGKFDGSPDRHTPVVRYFPAAVLARFFRIKPQDWHSHVSMRAGLVFGGFK